jgi:3-deoxy-D-manno-octulosonate 8-phosphate phosphatase (KDO 8-P phosphatase)
MIKVIVMDIDGTLTDGSIIYGENGLESKPFSVKDGLILSALPKLGIKAVLITGRNSGAARRRADELGCVIFQNVLNKQSKLQEYLAENNISLESAAYIGDDLNDYQAMKICGFKACPADAAEEIRAICGYVSPFAGGHGAVRDICGCILKAEGRYSEFLNTFGI